MLVTREMDYTLRILRALHRNGQLSAAAVAEQEHMQKAVTLKILKGLHSAGIVESRRGAAGGYRLSRSCSSLTLYDLFRTTGDRLFLNRCQEPGYRCENHPDGGCGICEELGRIQGVLDAELRRVPLNDIFRAPTRTCRDSNQ